ncbi:Hypothetical protein CINCED_3A001970 [Cinara cedri]|uniref:Uncharacterized protein n=1 Tax=Cinara cedri TaxID=506608 RepID=A0A5E4MAU4_9HEMI|nr:Hypothetical protein CINCED_3A001970 [Cinara cedri]
MSDMMNLALQNSGEHELTIAVVSEFGVCDMKIHVLPATKQNKAAIINLICLRTCYSQAIPVPKINSPIYIITMYNVVISVSNLKPEEKINLTEKNKRKTFYMSDIFSYHLRENATHLMFGKKAIDTGITVMTDVWLDVCEESPSHNINIVKEKCFRSRQSRYIDSFKWLNIFTSNEKKGNSYINYIES